jgi:UDP-N-acetylmuramate--alanine ligase
MSETYHFIGLGGIGMSALARILLQKGKVVQGSDSKASQLLEELQKEGAKVRVGHIGDATKVIYSSAIQDDHEELKQAKQKSLPLLHRSDLLHALMQGSKPLLVTGTHGKTTTSALLASVLVEAGWDPSFVIGGIHLDWKTNGRAGSGEYFVAEADESDGSFLKTIGFGAIVTNLDNDHLDYWKTPEKLEAAFGEFCAQANPDYLFWCGDDPRLAQLNPKGISYGFGEGNLLQVCSPFSIVWDGVEYRDIALNLLGRHNMLNAAAVFGLCLRLGVPEVAIRSAFGHFAGTGRRLEWKGKNRHGIDVYDDYGHHPTEIRATLQALREKVHERRIVAVFQPHRYSRVRDLFEEFPGCLEGADLAIMTDIYSAGEREIEGLNDRFRASMGVLYTPREGLEAFVAEKLLPHDVVVTFGAGDITKSGPEILEKARPRLKVGLLFGGTSSEHAVSLMSAQTFIESIDRTIYDVKLFPISKSGVWGTKTEEILSELMQCDVVIPIFHGQQGEDGMMGGFLETFNIPYVGCDYRSGAICMQKAWTKLVAIREGVPTSSFVEVHKGDVDADVEIEQFPVWVKPVHLGSSIGITRVTRKEDLKAAMDLAFSFDDALIIDQEIEGREIEFSLLGNDWVRVGPAAEISKPDVFHSYDRKYGAGASHIETPAHLTDEERKRGEKLAAKMYKAAGCKGLSRIDFFLDREGRYWFNEINPMPGFTKTSAYPQAWKSAGMEMKELCNELIILALHRSRQLQKVRGR